MAEHSEPIDSYNYYFFRECGNGRSEKHDLVREYGNERSEMHDLLNECGNGRFAMD